MAACKNIEDLHLLEVHEKNLAILKLQAAKHGSLNVPLHILNQIDDEERRIRIFGFVQVSCMERADARPAPTHYESILKILCVLRVFVVNFSFRVVTENKNLRRQKMRLKEKLGKEFVVTCELGGTEGTDVQKSLENAKSLNRADGLNIIDCAMARLRINTFSLAHIIQEELNISCIPHLTRRDRSILALQSDLLGGHCLGVRYVLTTTGDAPQHGPYKDSASVYNLNTPGLIKLISNLNKGLDYNGEGIKGNTEFFISATATPAAKNLDKEIELVKAKVDAGANFLQTQPVYSPEQAKRFLEKVKPLGVPVLIGVMPLKSVKMANYLNENVPGINVPDEVISSFEKYGSGIPVACEFINQIRDIADGIHILAMGNVENMNAIMDHI